MGNMPDAYCFNLTSITGPDSLTMPVEGHASFARCTSLTSMEVGSPWNVNYTEVAGVAVQ